MDKKNTWILAVVLIAAVLFITFISVRGTFSNQDTSDTASTSAWVNTPAQASKDVTISEKTVITAKLAYRGGEYIIAGEIPLPTPCHILEVEGNASEDRRSVHIKFASSVKSGEICTQVITPARFKVAVQAHKDAKISATLNGQEVTLNLIEAGQNEDLDNFDLYIKG